METKNLAGSLLSKMITPEMKRTQDMIENEMYSESLDNIEAEPISADDLYRVNPLSELTPPPSVCKISNCPTLTTGNFAMINGKAKSGKTFFIGAIVAACINNSLQLGNIKGCLPVDKRNILYFDTEQSEHDVNCSIKRIQQLAGYPSSGNLLAYGIRPLSTEQRVEFIIDKAMTFRETCSLIIIDGIRDLLSEGINDEKGATKTIENFMMMTAKLNCCIIAVLHQNKTDMKARGHIGTELINKSETIISIVKDYKTNIYTVSSQDSRHLSFNDFCFVIVDGVIKPVAMPVKAVKKDTSPEGISEIRHQAVIDEIFKAKAVYSYSGLINTLSEKFKLGKTATRDYIKFYQEQDYIIKEQVGRKVNYTINLQP
jgi:hypothetical protein